MAYQDQDVQLSLQSASDLPATYGAIVNLLSDCLSKTAIWKKFVRAGDHIVVNLRVKTDEEINHW